MRTHNLKLRLRRVVYALFVFSCWGIAQTTYYVNNTTGSDSSSGLSPNAGPNGPKRTITATIATASVGDTISVAATGQVYNEVIVLGKHVVLKSTLGIPHLRQFSLVLPNFPNDKVSVVASFLLDTLELRAGTIEGSHNLTITSNGKVIRTSPLGRVAQQLQFAGAVDLEYKGAGNMTTEFEIPATDSTIRNLTLNFDSSSPTPQLTLTRNLFVYNVNFINGLLVTGPYFVQLDNPAGSVSQGYVRAVQPGNRSHVVGNVRKTLKVGVIIPFGWNGFPVGDFLYYRPLAFTLRDSAGNRSLGINVTASETNQRPTGIVGFPIANGVSQGVDIARYPDFYWSVQADSTYNKEYTLELTAQDFSDYDDIANVRIIRRPGTVIDVTNMWMLVGHYNYYDNFLIAGVPTVISINAIGGIAKEGNIFAYGLGHIDIIANPILPIRLCPPDTVFTRNLKNPALFTGAQGTIMYSVAISDTSVATARIIGDTLIVSRGNRIGTTTCTVTGTDSYDGSRISTSFTVSTQCSETSVPESENEPPPSFSLKQNYPNPFNPSTTIEFALPQSQFVKLSVYNMLGEEIERLVENVLHAGRYKIEWNAKGFNSGIYFYRLQTGNFIETKKLILLK